MKLINYSYKSLEELEKFTKAHFRPHDHLLIQLFCGDFDHVKITVILHFLKSHFPKSVLIGTSTAGEISDGYTQDNTILLAFCQLEKSVAKAYYFPEVNFESGQHVARSIIEPDTKVCIAFAESFGAGDSEAFINGFNTFKPDIPLAGGNAADNFNFNKIFLIYEDQIVEKGIVLVTLNGERLRVNTGYSFEWTQIGKELTITKSDKNTLYEIDNQPVQKLYQHYLGDDVVQNFPKSGMEFPFVKICDEIDVCRAIIGVNPDGSYLYKGFLNEGEKIRFAIGNVEEILNKASLLQAKINEKPSEVIFIYSCGVRKHFLQKQLDYEFGLLQQIAPTAGFCTYGEFFHSHHKNQLLNVTTTVLSLSESDEIVSHTLFSKPKFESSTLKSLTHLVNTTQHEVDVNINFLNQYKMILDESCIVSKMDLNGAITYASEHFCNVSGYTKEELLGKTHRLFRPADADPALYANLWETIKAQKIWKGLIKAVDKAGNERYLKHTIMPIVDEHGITLEYICTHFDITDLVLKEKLIQKHFKDELTGFGNREALFHRLRLDESPKLLILLNLIGFSEINDYLGYDVGDELLKQIASFLMHSCNNHADVVFRINGDEFAVLLTSQDIQTLSNTHDHIKHMIHSLEKKVFAIKGYEVAVRLNVGVAEGTTDEMYMQSHVALKEAKLNNKAVVFYEINETLKVKTQHNIQIIQKIKAAIDHDRIVPFFQGIYDNKQQKITEVEVLMRLQEEDGSYLSPYYFLEQAKKTRLYEKLTKIMITKSFAYLKDADVDFSINFTKGDILSSSVKECLYDAIKKYQCAHRVIIEIVESEGIENFGEITSFIREVKKLGCRIAIDDFGTGYSNFAYLVKLEVDIIKIDGSLIKDIDTNPTSAMTVETIISFANKMGYSVIAEFVDREAIQEKLLSLHVNFSQGYLFSKPSPVLTLV